MQSNLAGGRAVLIILDGFGIGEHSLSNAIENARMPFYRQLITRYPHSKLITHGEAVGLPRGIMGNSEVGHTTMGAGRIIYQDLTRISKDIHDKKFDQNPVLRKTILAGAEKSGRVHLMGLLSPGGVHSHQRHAAAMARVLAADGVPVALHLFTDGRDTPPRAAPEYLRAFMAEIAGLPGVRIATLTGRYFAMDRDNRWDRVAQAYDALVDGAGATAPDALAAIAAAHARDVTDEFVPATALAGYAGMRDGDGVLCFNFRADRVREILGALLDPSFAGFARRRVVRFAAAAGMTEYSTALNAFLQTLFASQSMADILGEVVARAGRTQLRMAETEKYPHVTYFLNGGEETPYPGEDRIMVPSPKVATYDLQPEMSAPELTEKAVEAINSQKYELIVLNFANPDMVGHTGSLPAAITAVETVDAALGRIAAAVAAQGGALLATADHGNCEMMKDPATGGPHTAHTTNPVPVLLQGGPAGATLRDGRLADVAPTLLSLLGLAQPAAMTGRSLLG